MGEKRQIGGPTDSLTAGIVESFVGVQGKLLPGSETVPRGPDRIAGGVAVKSVIGLSRTPEVIQLLAGLGLMYVLTVSYKLVRAIFDTPQISLPVRSKTHLVSDPPSY